MTDVQIIVTGLQAIQTNMKQIANILSTPGIDVMLYDIGKGLRDIARVHVNSAVYHTPQSKNSQRTRFLYNTIYIATDETTDYDECFQRGYAGAVAVYPGRDTATTYQMLPQLIPQRGTVLVAAGAIYAEYVEYGNGSVGPRPFMRPAEAKAADIGVEKTDNYIRQFLSRAGARTASRSSRNALGQFTRG